MSNVSFSSLIGDIQKYAYSPMDMRDVIFSALENATDGTLDVVDASNPFVYAISATVATTAAFMKEDELRTRRLYPVAAMSEDDLYLHMSDKDYTARFAVPSTATITVLMQKTPLIEAMVTDVLTNNKVTIIPRNTVFKVAGVSFSMQYPIEIRQLAHGGLQITYLNDLPSPLRTLSSNLVQWTEYTDAQRTQWVELKIDVDQFFVTTQYNDVSTSAGMLTEIAYSDQYCYTRCWMQNSQGAWVEIQTTYTDSVYDPNTVTALIQVLEGKVRVTVPVVYAKTGKISGKLRMDVYQSRGALRMQLASYTSGEYSAKWYNIDTAEDTDRQLGVRKINNVIIYSTSSIDAGRDALTFDQLKARVIANSVGTQILPITQAQLKNDVIDLGYTISKHVDTLTDRIFIASRDLPSTEDESVLTPITASQLTTTVHMNTAAQLYGVYDNGDAITIADTAVYRSVNGLTSVITTAQMGSLQALTPSQRCKALSSGEYFFSPFTYVLDATNAVFEVRAYALDDPKIEARTFIEENETLSQQVSSSQDITLTREGSTYILRVRVSSSDSYKALANNQVYAQLSISSINQASRVSVQGSLEAIDATSHERIWRFDLGTNFNVNASSEMEFPSIASTTNGLTVRLGLIQKIDLLYITTAIPSTYRASASDLLIDSHRYTDDLFPAVICREQLTLKFGTALKSLWAQSRSAVTDIPVRVYDQDIPAYYERDVYRVNASGAYFSVDAQGRLVYDILHHKGDPVLDSVGAQVYKHLKGEPIIDLNGNASYVDGYKRQMARYIDITMLPGAYYFCTDAVIKSYLKQVRERLSTWITQDLQSYQDYLLENTRIYFRPAVSSGMISVLDGSNVQSYIHADQSLTVKLYVTKSVYENDVLRKKLYVKTVKSIHTALQATQVSKSYITSALRQEYGDDVLDVQLSGLAGSDKDDNVLTVIDDGVHLSIARRLVVREDGVLTVQEDVDVQFIVHSNI